MKVCAYRALIAHIKGNESRDAHERDGILHIIGSLEDDVVMDLVRDRVEEILPEVTRYSV